MTRLKTAAECVFLAILLLAAVLAWTGRADASQSCGTIHTHRYPVAVHVSASGTSCQIARLVAAEFMNHRGARRGSDLATGYWLVQGWKCQTGTDGASGCHHHSSRLNFQAEETAEEENSRIAEEYSIAHEGEIGTSGQIELWADERARS